MIEITLNDQKVQVEEGCTILDAANKIGVDIPALCHQSSVEPYGACRLCTVEIHDGRKTRMVTACNYPIRTPITVNTVSEKTVNTRNTLIQMMISRWPNVPYIKDMAEKYKVVTPDYTHPKIDYDENACVLCGLCVRICKQDGILEGITGFTGRGSSRAVDIPYEQYPDKCQECHKCEAVCPTGAITIPTEFVRIKEAITAALESGPKSIPEVAKATKLPLPVVTYNLMSLQKFGQIAVGDLDENDEYYFYELPEE
ncbi:(2Fe-2S)-binding protein [bacterium]|nr:(2Fe-2S)-binding protein [bacterium]